MAFWKRSPENGNLDVNGNWSSSGECFSDLSQAVGRSPGTLAVQAGNVSFELGFTYVQGNFQELVIMACSVACADRNVKKGTTVVWYYGDQSGSFTYIGPQYFGRRVRNW